VRVPERQSYVLDTAQLTADEQVAACRLVLTVVATDVASFETDIPWASASEWPNDVNRAARHLSSLKPPGRGESDLYRRSGELQRGDDRAWSSFVTFAPFAYDATAWASDSREIVRLADAATTIVVTLTSEQVTLVANDVAVLVPLSEWRKRR
jgi:hypothetical protein